MCCVAWMHSRNVCFIGKQHVRAAGHYWHLADDQLYCCLSIKLSASRWHCKYLIVNYLGRFLTTSRRCLSAWHDVSWRPNDRRIFSVLFWYAYYLRFIHVWFICLFHTLWQMTFQLSREPKSVGLTAKCHPETLCLKNIIGAANWINAVN